MIKKLAVLILAAIGIAGCSPNPSMSNTNSNAVVQTTTNTSVVSSHSTETNSMPTANPNSAKPPSSSGGGSPMAKAIDTSQMTAAIDKADKAYKAKPTDEKAKNDLAEAYFTRAFALTEAAQYRSALGDFRKGLKLNPNNADAKGMHDQIINIFQSIGREPPKEGDEPPPLPFNGSGEKTTSNSGSERINFTSGATTATATGNLKNYDDAKSFVVKVNAGQTLKTEQVKDEKSLHYVTVSVKDPKDEYVGDSDASCNNRKEISPTVAGDYILEVKECQKADAWSGDFRLKVIIK